MTKTEKEEGKSTADANTAFWPNASGTLPQQTSYTNDPTNLTNYGGNVTYTGTNYGGQPKDCDCKDCAYYFCQRCMNPGGISIRMIDGVARCVNHLKKEESG